MFKKMMLGLALAGVFTVLLGSVGCSTSAGLKTDDAVRAPADASDASEVKVYSTNKIGKSYKTIGIVVADADAGDDAEKAVKALRQEAAQLGANAIVGLRLEVNYGFINSAIRATGTAVRY
jgi:hypothetical protein